jgi:hypothetical protein
MSPTGGGFGNLITDLEKYGFINTGGGLITITDAGKLVLYGTSAEIDETITQAITGIDLFRELNVLYGATASIEQIKAFLRQKANVAVDEAQKLAPKIDAIYKKVSKYISSAEKPSAVPSPIINEVKNGEIGRREIMIPSNEKIQPLKVQFGNVYIQIPADANSLEAIKLAIDTLEFMKQRIMKEQKEQGKGKPAQEAS